MDEKTVPTMSRAIGGLIPAAYPSMMGMTNAGMLEVSGVDDMVNARASV